jgi:hypothetical protein
MTKVNVTFTAPENQHGVQLNQRSQAAWDQYEVTGGDDDWEYFLEVFSWQMEDHIRDYTEIDEVYEAD